MRYINLHYQSIYLSITCRLNVAHLRFWYQVLTCVSLRFSFEASSMRSWTLRYFCLSKLCSSVLSWWSVNAVLALRVFFDLLLPVPLPPGFDPPWWCRGWPPDKPPAPPPLSDWPPPEPHPPSSDNIYIYIDYTIVWSSIHECNECIQRCHDLRL